MGKKGRISNCSINFKVKCPVLWESLEMTEQEDVRFCSRCEKDVYLCSTRKRAIAYAKLGRCIAYEYDDRLMLGEPENDLIINKRT